MALWATLAASAAADVYDDNPATASRGPGDAWIFVRAADGAILERHLSNGSWTAWASLGGNAGSGPTAVAVGDTLHSFYRGLDGAINENVLSGGTWSGWKSIGGYLTSAAGVALRRGTGIIDLAVKGYDTSVNNRAWDPGDGWAPWGWIAGSVTSAPSLNSPGPGAWSVWARSAAGTLTVRSYNPANGWSDWTDRGASILGAPAANSRAAGYQNVYVRGLDGSVSFTWAGPNAVWSGFEQVNPRPVDSSPAVASDGPDHEWIVARGGSGLLFLDWRTDRGFSSWTDLGPIALPASEPPPAAPPAPGSLDIPAATGCTLTGDRLRVRIALKQVKGRIASVTFFTKGRGATRRTDRKAPFDVRLPINRPAGSKGRVYARIAYRASARGKLRHKTVSGPYKVCR